MVDDVHWGGLIGTLLRIFLEIPAVIIIELCARSFVPSYLVKLEEKSASRKTESEEFDE